jgi:hypothetical protein
MIELSTINPLNVASVNLEERSLKSQSRNKLLRLQVALFGNRNP